MKVLIVLSLAVCAVAADHGFAYSAYAPLTNPIAPYYMPYPTPYAYGYSAPAPMISAPAPVMAPVATVVKTQYHMQNELGQASYGFSEPHHAQSSVQDAAGNRVGSFSFINPEGKLVQTNYVADAMGYRVESNDLPVAPMDLPAPVQDTPEVTEARAKFFKIFEEVKARSDETMTAEETKDQETAEETEEVKSRARRSVPVQTPASTSPLTSAVVAPIATRTVIPQITPMSYPSISPIAYSTAYPYSSPIPYAAPFHYSTPYSHPYPYYSGLYYSM